MDEYNRLDPDMRSGDVVMNLEVAAGSEVFYTVAPGDSLSKIATKYQGLTWQKIFEANRDQIKNPDLIHPETTVSRRRKKRAFPIPIPGEFFSRCSQPSQSTATCGLN